MQKLRYRLAFATGLVFVGSPALAGSVVLGYVDLDEGVAVALLEASSQRHVDAMRRIIAERYPGGHSMRRWEVIEEHMRNATLARFEYRYEEGGEMIIRTYHALGGDPLGRIADRALAGEVPPSPTDSASSGDDSDSDIDSQMTSKRASDDELEAGEWRDTTSYAGFDEHDIRAPFRPRGRSVMQPSWQKTRYHALDAEQKALRAIEEDILDGKMPRGGSIRGWLSGSVCAECRQAVRVFADTYELDIRLNGMSPAVPVKLKEQLLATGRARMKGPRLVDAASGRPLVAFDALYGARQAQVRESLAPHAVEREAAGGPWQPRAFRLGPPRRTAPAPGTDPANDSRVPGAGC
jgi:hypothetical protein